MGISILATMPAAALVLLPALRFNKVPMHLAVRVVLNSALGLAALTLLYEFSGDPWVACAGDIAAAGILGLPGVGLLYIVRWLLG